MAVAAIAAVNNPACNLIVMLGLLYFAGGLWK